MTDPKPLTREELDRYESFLLRMGLPPNEWDERLVAQSRRCLEQGRELDALRELDRLVRAMHNREELNCNLGRLYEVRDLLKAIDEARK